MTRYKNFFDQKETKKISLSVQRSVVESFKFNGKNISSFYIKDVGQCLVAKDVSKAVGYDNDGNARRAVRTHVPGKYRMRLGHAKNILRREVNIDLPKEDTVLMKEPGLYCLLLRLKKPKTEPFMEWAVETVLTWEVWKLASVIEEKDASGGQLDRGGQLEALDFTNEVERQAHQQEILRLNEEINDLISNRHIARHRCFDNMQCFIKKNIKEVHRYYVIRCQYR